MVACVRERLWETGGRRGNSACYLLYLTLPTFEYCTYTVHRLDLLGFRPLSSHSWIQAPPGLTHGTPKHHDRFPFPLQGRSLHGRVLQHHDVRAGGHRPLPAGRRLLPLRVVGGYRSGSDSSNHPHTLLTSTNRNHHPSKTTSSHSSQRQPITILILAGDGAAASGGRRKSPRRATPTATSSSTATASSSPTSNSSASLPQHHHRKDSGREGRQDEIRIIRKQ